MNTNEVSPKPNARLSRIQKAGGILRMLILISLIFTAYFYLAFFFGWPAPHDMLRIAVSPHHIYTSPSEMPPTILALVMVRTGLAVFGMVVLSSLFRLYQHGIIFSARNVSYIRLLGYYLIIDWVADYIFQGTLRDMDLSITPIFAGLLIIFVAWIMDEGRKIREEQELTV